MIDWLLFNLKNIYVLLCFTIRLMSYQPQILNFIWFTIENFLTFVISFSFIADFYYKFKNVKSAQHLFLAKNLTKVSVLISSQFGNFIDLSQKRSCCRGCCSKTTFAYWEPLFVNFELNTFLSLTIIMVAFSY